MSKFSMGWMIVSVFGASLAAAQPPAGSSPASRPQVGTPASAPASSPASAPKPPSPHGQGPLRVELSAMLEGRYRYFDDSMQGQMRDNELRMQFRVAGAEIGKVVRHGNLILEEVIDDTGQSLFDPSSTTEEQRKTTRLSTTPPERLQETGLLLVAQCKATTRAARTLRSIRGSVRLVFSSGYQEVTIINPLQYLGKPLDLPKFKELGVEAEVIAPNVFTPPADEKGTFTIRFKQGGDRIRGVSFYDGWMKVLRSRATPVQLPSGEECQQFRIIGGSLDEKSQMVIQVFPDAREETVRFELKDLAAP